MASTQSFPRIVDAHCHVHDCRLRYHLGDVLRHAKALNVTHVATCACHEDDWCTLEELLVDLDTSRRGEEQDLSDKVNSAVAVRSVQILPSFGIHPWWADGASPEYLSLLRAKLAAYPNAMLGEIGLCKSARGKQVDRVVQERVFHDQLTLAAELQRGVVIHCVGAYGKLLEILQHHQTCQALPPMVILHSYSGPAEMVPAFLALERNPHGTTFKVFFSLNAKQLANTAARNPQSINNSNAKPSKSVAACASIPVDALLLETDAPDQPPLGAACDLFQSALLENHGLNEPALVQLALQGAAAIRRMPIEELAPIVYQNACRAFALESEQEG